MTIWLLALALVIVAAAVIVLVVRRSPRERRPAVFGGTLGGREEETTGEPEPIPPRWPRRAGLDPDTLDDEARASVIESLATLGEDWAMNVLAQAYEEEHDPLVRVRILSELRGARTAEARATLERATRASEPAERSLAVEALAEIGALDSVERTLSDPCIPVAQTALLALMKNGGRDRVTIFLRQAEPERAAELRRVIDLIELK